MNYQPVGIAGLGYCYDFSCLAMDFTGLNGFAVYFKASVNDHIERPEVVDYEIIDYKIETNEWRIVSD